MDREPRREAQSQFAHLDGEQLDQYIADRKIAQAWGCEQLTAALNERARREAEAIPDYEQTLLTPEQRAQQAIHDYWNMMDRRRD